MSAKLFAYGFGQLCQYVGMRFIHDGVHGVKTQAIEVILLEPVKRIVNKEIADNPASRTIKVDGIAPGGAMATSEKLWSVSAKVIPFRTKVVVDHIQKDH